MAYDRYREAVPATIAEHGGRYLARGGTTEVLEGGWRPSRLVIVEFPTVEAARAWYGSERYQEVVRVRHETAESQLVLTEGLSG